MPRTLGTRRHYLLLDFIVEKREKAGLTQHEISAPLRRYQSLKIASIETGQRRLEMSWSCWTWRRLSASTRTRLYAGLQGLLQSRLTVWNRDNFNSIH